MDPLEVVRRRLVNQRLAGDASENVADAVGWLGAVQAQEFAEAKWSLAERLGNATDESVETAFDRGEIIRTHALRPTWHFLSRKDARWILRLTRQRVHALNAYWYRKADLDGPLFVRSDRVLARAVAGGESLTRVELGARLADAGIVAAGPRLAYLLMHAELEEIVCSGPRRGRQHTYAHFDERVPATAFDDRPYDTAIEELVWRYLQSHGPATVKDFATWSSLPVRDSRAAVQRLEERIDSWVDPDGTVWHSARHVASAGIRQERLEGAFLLPMYDEMIVAHQDLRVALDAPLPRTDFLERVVVIHGVTVGTWKRTLGARSAVVQVSLLRELTAVEGRALEAVVERFERFLGVNTSLRSVVVG